MATTRPKLVSAYIFVLASVMPVNTTPDPYYNHNQIFTTIPREEQIKIVYVEVCSCQNQQNNHQNIKIGQTLDYSSAQSGLNLHLQQIPKEVQLNDAQLALNQVKSTSSSINNIVHHQSSQIDQVASVNVEYKQTHHHHGGGVSQQSITQTHHHSDEGDSTNVSSEEELHKKHKNVHYRFEYAVNDAKSGDKKRQVEERKGDVVNGEYSLVEEDGNVRTVKYYADWKNGFHAQVYNSKPR